MLQSRPQWKSLPCKASPPSQVKGNERGAGRGRDLCLNRSPVKKILKGALSKVHASKVQHPGFVASLVGAAVSAH